MENGFGGGRRECGTILMDNMAANMIAQSELQMKESTSIWSKQVQ